MPTPLDDRVSLLLESATDLSASSRELAGAALDAAEYQRIGPGAATVLRLLDLPLGATVAEFGAGFTATTRLLSEISAEVVSRQPSSVLAEQVRRRCPVVTVTTDAFDGEFDLMVAVHRRLPERELFTLADRLPPGGRLLATASGPTLAAAQRSGLLQEHVVTDGPTDQVRTIRRGRLDPRGSPAAIDTWISHPPLTGRPRRSTDLVVLGRGDQAALLPALARSTTVDGRRLLAGDGTLHDGPAGTMVTHQVQHLQAPGPVRLAGGSRRWVDGGTILDRIRAGEHAVFAEWRALVEREVGDGRLVTLVPRHIVGSPGEWTAVGADLRADDWTATDVLAHGLLDSARGSRDPAALAATWANDVGLAPGWLPRARGRLVALHAAVHGVDESTAVRLSKEWLSGRQPSPFRPRTLADRFRSGLRSARSLMR